MFLASTEMVFVLPLSLYFLISNCIPQPPSPWVSWAFTHHDFGDIGFAPYEVVEAFPDMKTSVDLTRWAAPCCAFVFFLHWGFSREAFEQYKQVWWMIVAPLGFKPSPPKPRPQTSSWYVSLAIVQFRKYLNF